MTQSKIDVSFPEARIILLRTEKEPNTVYLQIEKERANIRVALNPASVSVLAHRFEAAGKKRTEAEALMAELGADPEAPPADSKAGGAIGAWKEAVRLHEAAGLELQSAEVLYFALFGALPLPSDMAVETESAFSGSMDVDSAPAAEESEPEAAPEPAKPAKRKKG